LQTLGERGSVSASVGVEDAAPWENTMRLTGYYAREKQ